MSFQVTKPGMMTTIQDLGRTGYQKFGVSQSGAMDKISLMAANALVGNDLDAAGLECMIIGPELQFEEDQIIAITGADISPAINGKSVDMYTPIRIKSGDCLQFAQIKKGCRAYIAFAGGLEADKVMGSMSTDQKLGIGGIDGKKLDAWDRIHVKNDEIESVSGVSLSSVKMTGEEKELLMTAEPQRTENGSVIIDVVKGPQFDQFKSEGIETFFGSDYEITPDSNRMGIRLNGEKIEQLGDGNIISDGIAEGAVQVPSSGMPIIMMADRQTTGGYCKIANVISTDIGKLSQCMPGTKTRFREVSVEDAQAKYKQCLQLIRRIREEAVQKRESDVRSGHRYRITVGSKIFDVEVIPE